MKAAERVARCGKQPRRVWTPEKISTFVSIKGAGRSTREAAEAAGVKFQTAVKMWSDVRYVLLSKGLTPPAYKPAKREHRA